MAKDSVKVSKKDNSKRRFGGPGPRQDRNEQKRAEAKERQATYDAIPVAEKLQRKLGKKERAKLEKRHGRLITKEEVEVSSKATVAADRFVSAGGTHSRAAVVRA